MRVIPIESIAPTVRIVNYIEVAAGASWPEREIPDFELIYVVRGRYEYMSSKLELVAEPGQVLLIPPGERHTFRLAAAERDGLVSCLHGELAAGSWAAGDYRLEVEPPRLVTCGDGELMHGLFRRCADAFGSYGRLHGELTRTIAREIWLRLAEHWQGASDWAVSPRMEQMVAFLREHLLEPVNRQDVAARFHLTPEHVNWLFRRELGMSPTQFILRERVLLAYRLIQQEGLSVKEAASRVGFNDPFYFSRVFKRIAGVSPSQV